MKRITMQVALGAVLIGRLHANIITVGPGGGYNHSTITAALTNAVAGDTIRVAQATYSAGTGESFPLRLPQAVTLESQPTNTTQPHLQGDGLHTVVSIETGGVTVRGFRITDGLGSEGINLMDGGGICVFVGPDETNTVHIENCLIENNQCTSDETYDGCGGGIYCGGTYCECFQIQLHGCIVRNNAVPGNGAGVCCALLSIVRIEDTLIEDNTAEDNGGGVYVDVYGFTALSANTRLVRNDSVGDLVRTNFGGKGGGLFCESYGFFVMTNCLVAGNTAKYYGGGIFTRAGDWVGDDPCLPGARTPEIAVTLLATNWAGVAGGGTYLGSSGRLVFNQTTNYWNDAYQDGGAVFVADGVSSSASVRFTNECLLEGNQCAGRGGGVFLGTSALGQFATTRFLGNSALLDGGAVFQQGKSSSAFTNCLLTYNNSARGYGGGLYLAPLATNNLSRCTVVGNFAPFGRSGLCLNTNASLTVSNSILWRNAGGSIETNGANVQMAYSLNDNQDPRFVGWGTKADIYVNSAVAGPGSGTATDPYRDLQIGLDGFDFRLATNSPYLGTMGAYTGTTNLPAGNSVATLNLTNGAYDIRGRNVIFTRGLRGNGSTNSTIYSAVFGYIENSFIRDLAITGERWYSGLTTRGDLVLTGCRIHHNECFSDGGGAYLAAGAIAATNCLVEGNGCDTRGGGVFLADGLQLAMESSKVLGNESRDHGGGLYLGENSRTMLSRTEVFDNHNDRYSQSVQAWGGGIYALGVHNLDILGSQLSRNTSYVNGGGVALGGAGRILNSTVSTNGAADDGAGVYVVGTLLASNSWFTANKATGSLDNRGGGMIVKSTANALIQKCYFIANVGQDRGSGMTIEGPTTILDSEFIGNGAPNGYRNGGAIEANSGAYPYCSNCLFQANFANLGGGLYVNGGKSPAFVGCKFYGNLANDDGGVAWCLGNSAPFFDGCHFVTNRAVHNGGAFNAQSSRTVVQNSDFVCNSAERGGAVASWSTDHSLFLACNFFGSQATTTAGALWASNTASPLLDMCVFATNRCQGNGGAIACDDQSTVTLSGVQFLDSQGADGGALFATGSSTARVDRCYFRGNLADDFANDADGGAAQITDHAVAYFTCSRLEQNVAKDDGGGVAIDGAAQVFFTNVFLVQNIAGDSGGGAYFYGSTTGLFVNCTLASNTAVDSDGGGLWLDNAASVTLDSSIVFSNSPDDIRLLATPVVTYSCVGKAWGAGNITNNPLFQADFTLAGGSPCRNTGNPALTDCLDGTRADMGASGGPLGCCVPSVDGCWLVRPTETRIEAGFPTEWVYGRIQIIGLTDALSALPGVEAWLGYGPPGTDPSTWTTWRPGVFNSDVSGGDEYRAQLTVSQSGEYRYAWRFRYGTSPWYYGDLDGSTNGVALDQLGVLLIGPSDLFEFSYPNFCSTNELELVGSTFMTNCLIRLTPEVSNNAGAIWRRIPFQVAAGFETEFDFRISRDAGDGLAFVIQNAGPRASGSSGGSMAYNFGNSVAVEFDTVRNLGSWGDPNDNHISVHTRGPNVNSAFHVYSLGSATNIPFMSDSNVHHVRISYSPSLLQLWVYLDSMAAPALKVPLNLEQTLGLTSGHAYVGFTAGTGSPAENHDILNWSIRANRNTVLASDFDAAQQTFRLSFYARLGESYTVLTSTNLVRWTVLTNLVGTGNTVVLGYPVSNSESARFFRLLVGTPGVTQSTLTTRVNPAQQRLTLSFNSQIAQNYRLLSTTNLAMPVAEWPVLTNWIGDGSSVEFTDPSPTNLPARFYLLRTP